MKICEYVDDSDDKFAIAIENIRENFSDSVKIWSRSGYIKCFRSGLGERRNLLPLYVQESKATGRLRKLAMRDVRISLRTVDTRWWGSEDMDNFRGTSKVHCSYFEITSESCWNSETF